MSDLDEFSFPLKSGLTPVEGKRGMFTAEQEARIRERLDEFDRARAKAAVEAHHYLVASKGRFVPGGDAK